MKHSRFETPPPISMFLTKSLITVTLQQVKRLSALLARFPQCLGIPHTPPWRAANTHILKPSHKATLTTLSLILLSTFSFNSHADDMETLYPDPLCCQDGLVNIRGMCLDGTIPPRICERPKISESAKKNLVGSGDEVIFFDTSERKAAPNVLWLGELEKEMKKKAKEQKNYNDDDLF